MATKRRKRTEDLPVLHPDAAGIDVGASELFVAVPADRDPEPVRSYPHLPEISTNLQIGCRAAVFAPWPWSPPACTGSRCTRSWRPAASRSSWSMRTTSRTFPAGKSDVSDCQWIQYLHSGGPAAGQLSSTRGDLRDSLAVAPPRQPH